MTKLNDETAPNASAVGESNGTAAGPAPPPLTPRTEAEEAQAVAKQVTATPFSAVGPEHSSA
eukprot:scaffold28721_cov40-Phaeocystis_antarctica.AAC.1